MPFQFKTSVGLILICFAVSAYARTVRTPALRQEASAPPRDSRPPGVSLIGGRVVAADTKHPVDNALVTVTQATGARAVVTAHTDSDGRFVVRAVDAQFTLTVSKRGYLDASYSHNRTARHEHNDANDVVIEMIRTSVVAGIVTADDGSPAVGAPVHLLRIVGADGGTSVVRSGTAVVDDRGAYRITGVLAGEYLVAIDVDGASDGAQSYAGSTRPAVLYYPGATALSGAEPIRVGPGDVREGINVQLRQVKSGRVVGVLTGGDARSRSRIIVRLAESSGRVPDAFARLASTNADGAFVFDHVVEGDYTLSARISSTPPGVNTFGDSRHTTTAGDTRGDAANQASSFGAPRPMWATAPVVVADQNDSPATLALAYGRTVSGRVVFDASAPYPVHVASLQVMLIPVRASDGDAVALETTTRVSGDGSFQMRDVMPGHYVVSVIGEDPGWSLVSCEVAGDEALDSLLDLTHNQDTSALQLRLSDRLAAIGGVVTSGSGHPLSAYTLLLVAADRRYWTPWSRRVRAQRLTEDGRYMFKNIPAGQYVLIAVSGANEADVPDPTFLESSMATGLPVAIVEGQQLTQTIRLAP